MLQLDSLIQVAKDVPIIKEVIVNVADTVTNFVYIKEVPVSEGWSADTWMNFWSIMVTLFAVGIALFGKEIINWWYRINLDINTNEIIIPKFILENDLRPITYFKFFLEVKDKKGKKLVKNARVRLLSVTEFIEDNPDTRIVNSESLFYWFKIDEESYDNNFLDSSIITFGTLNPLGYDWQFNLKYKSHNPLFNTTITKGRTLIYELDIRSDNYFSNRKYYFQVYFDGKVTTNIKDMNKHLQIRKVNSIDDFREPIKYENKKEVIVERPKKNENLNEESESDK